jgi:hypothetical protein
MPESPDDPNPSNPSTPDSDAVTDQYGWHLFLEHDWILPLAMQAVAGQPEWRRWRTSYRETVEKCRSVLAQQRPARRLGQRPGSQDTATRYKILEAALTYIGTLVMQAEDEFREREAGKERPAGTYSTVESAISLMLEHAYGSRSGNDLDKLTATVIWALLNGCTPDTLGEFLSSLPGPAEDETTYCARAFRFYQQYREAKALADALDDPGQEDWRV